MTDLLDLVGATPELWVEPCLSGAGLLVSGPLTAQLTHAVSTDHLHRLSDDTATLEHAEGAIARLEHGYCTDDVSRALQVLCALPRPSEVDLRLADRSMAFLRAAAVPLGRFRSRMSYARDWIDDGASDDASGRALLALGAAAHGAPARHLRWMGHLLFERQADFRSLHPRSMALATIGACSVIDAGRRDGTAHDGAAELARHAAEVLPRLSLDAEWPWPERRLTYANAAMPEALLALARTVAPELLQPGLDMLAWLTDAMTSGEHLSPPGDAGWAHGESRPGFDQQPIEMACTARASSAAWHLTGDVRWLRTLVLCAGWFLGFNDGGVALIDVATGGCCDGLEPVGRNENQGAESTLAWMETALLVQQQIDSGAVRVVVSSAELSR